MLLLSSVMLLSFIDVISRQPHIQPGLPACGAAADQVHLGLGAAPPETSSFEVFLSFWLIILTSPLIISYMDFDLLIWLFILVCVSL